MSYNPNTGQGYYNPNNAQLPPGTNAQASSGGNPLDVFTAAAKAKVQPNPFNPGTQQYADFQTSQAKQLTDYAGAPSAPTFSSARNPDGTLQNQYDLNPQNVNFQSILPGVSDAINNVNTDQSGLNAIKQRALSTGPSAWLNLQNQAQDQQQTADTENAKQQGAAATAGADSSLAMRGGIDSGARERVAKAGANNTLNATQGIARQGSANKTNLAIADNTTQTGLLSQLPGMAQNQANFDLSKQTDIGNVAQQQQAAGLGAQEYNATNANSANQFNIQNALNDLTQNRAYDLNNYNQQMQAFGAGKTADAQANAGKK